MSLSPFLAPPVITGVQLAMGAGGMLLAGGGVLIYATSGTSESPDRFSPFTPYAPDPNRDRLTLGFPRPTPPERLPGFDQEREKRQNPLGFPGTQNPTWQERFDPPVFGPSNPPGYPSPSNNPLNHYLSSNTGNQWDNIPFEDREELDGFVLPESKTIAQGHAWKQHAEQFGVTNQYDLAKEINYVISNPSHSKNLLNDRKAYYDGGSNTLVIVDPHDAADGGTVFKPDNGIDYYNTRVK